MGDPGSSLARFSRNEEKTQPADKLTASGLANGAIIVNN
jgi:hypothetical protein